MREQQYNSKSAGQRENRRNQTYILFKSTGSPDFKNAWIIKKVNIMADVSFDVTALENALNLRKEN